MYSVTLIVITSQYTTTEFDYQNPLNREPADNCPWQVRHQ